MQKLRLGGRDIVTRAGLLEQVLSPVYVRHLENIVNEKSSRFQKVSQAELGEGLAHESK